MKTVKSIFGILNLKTLIVLVLSVASTWGCSYYEIYADFPLTLIGIAVVFPIVFSIGGAYTRRENALNHYGTIKAHGRALFFASRDWIEDSDEKFQSDLKYLLKDLLVKCRELFHADFENMEEEENRVYQNFSQISLFIKEFRTRGMTAGEVSRSNQYLSKIINAFESMKHIYQYRTPRTLRAYSKIFIFLIPVLYGPYFADLSKEYDCWLAYVMPVLFTVILVGLDNIQDHLENPFDQIGEDDIQINAEKFVERLDL